VALPLPLAKHWTSARDVLVAHNDLEAREDLVAPLTGRTDFHAERSRRPGRGVVAVDWRMRLSPL